MSKKMSYIDLLKEAVNNYGNEHDTSDTVDNKGPFLDNILSYDGEGELTTYKDASSILERYYFDHDEGVESLQEATEAEPAGADDSESVDKAKKDTEKKVTEQEEKDEEEEEESEDLSETEKSIVEKLVEEMEEEDEQVNESVKDNEPAGMPDKDSEKYIPEQEEEKDEESEDNEEEELDVDKELEEWGTGILDEQEDKDEDEEKEEKDEEEEEEEEEKEEVEEKKNKKAANEAGPAGGPLGHNKSSGKKRGKYDNDEDAEAIDEQFQIFKKQIMESEDNTSDEDVEDINNKDVIV